MSNMNKSYSIMHNKKDTFDTFVKIAIIVLAAGSILAAVKCVFVGLQRDEEYAITLSYRLINGDRLLTQVWDPHQTSAFLLSAIEWIFIKATGGTVYLVLWCKIVGTIIHAFMAFYLYRTLLILTPRKNTAFLLGLLYFGILPKDGIIPEFSLMMAWFTTLIIITLIRIHFASSDASVKSGMNKANDQVSSSKNRIIFQTVLLSVFSFCLILSYPACILVVPFLYAFLIVDRKRNPKAVLYIFPVVTVLLGLAYLGYLFSYMSFGDMICNVKEALVSCGSHDYKEISKSAGILKDMIVFAAISAIAGICSYLITIIGRVIIRKFYLGHKTSENPGATQKNNKKLTDDICTSTCLIAIILCALSQVFFCIFGVFEYMYNYDFTYYFWIYALATAILLKNRKEENRTLFLRIIIINILGFLSVMVLTNLTIFSSVPYCISGLIISLFVIVLHSDKKNTHLKRLAMITLLTVAFSNIFFKGFTYSSNDGYNWNVLCANKLIHSGAAKGIITEYMTGYINEKAQNDWDKYILDGDNVLVWDITSICYLNKDVNIASYTTISTPTYYVDSIEKYWAENPDKYPDVIAVSIWFGDNFRMDDRDDFLGWIENEYNADEVIEEDYYRYYIRRSHKR